MLKAFGTCYENPVFHHFLCSKSSRQMAKVTAKTMRSVSKIQGATIRKYGYYAFAGVYAFRGLLFSKAFCEHSKARKVEPDESPWLISSETIYETELAKKSNHRFAVVRGTIYAWRLFFVAIKISVRICVLSVYFLPLMLTYPILCHSEETRMLWWRIAIWAMQSSGPTIIKLGQWASTRRDLFSKEFCDKLAVLHNKVSDIGWRHSRSLVDELFKGISWESFLLSIEPKPVGSGCIAQVYKAQLDVKTFQSITGAQLEGYSGKGYIDVAIKVAKPNIRERIAIDLAILRALVRVAQAVVPGLFFVNPLSSLHQFEIVLQRQVDLRNEARALKRFSDNFDPERSHVRFPKVFRYSKDVIIETYEAGMPVNKLVTGDVKDLAHQNTAVRRRVALLGARAILKMIFVDNFVHGDLHPGNILVRFNDNSNGNGDIHRSPFDANVIARAIEYVKEKFVWTHQPSIRFTNNMEYEDEPTLVILDTGIAIEEAPKNLRNLRSLFRAIIEKRGFDVGKLLIEHSPQNNCSKPDEFCLEVEKIVKIARSSGSLRKLEISHLLNNLFSIVSNYQVGLETSFTTVVLAVMVLEGLGRSLDPDLDLFQCAYPFLFSGVLY